MKVLNEVDNSLPLVQLAVTALTGAEFDPPGKEGLSRLTTRLMRRTGLGMDAEQLDEQIDALGSSLGVDVGVSSMGFAGSVISRSLDDYVGVFAGVLATPSLAVEELERLVRETKDELLELRDNDRALVRMWFRAALFGSHAYGRSTIGTPSSISNIDELDVRAYYERHFVPSNLVMAAAGEVDETRSRQIRERLCAELTEGRAPASKLAHPTPHAGRRLLFVDKPERTQTQILIGALGTHPADADHTPLLVANTVFGGTFTARMTQEIRAKRGWSYGAYSSLPFDRKRQAFSMWTFPAADDAAACISLQLSMLEEWHDEGITEQELEWAKSYLVRSNVFHVDTASKRMGLLLDEEVYGLPERYYEDYPARVAAVTLEQANAAVRERICPKDVLIAVVGTEKTVGRAVIDAVEGLSEHRVVAFDDDPASPW